MHIRHITNMEVSIHCVAGRRVSSRCYVYVVYQFVWTNDWVQGKLFDYGYPGKLVNETSPFGLKCVVCIHIIEMDLL